MPPHVDADARPRPHTTSMVAWDVPSPVIVDRPFTVKVGVACAERCPLGGRLIEVCDEAGVRIGAGTLGQSPWPGTRALYAADVEVVAPAAPGITAWMARFAAVDLEVPHEESSVTFSVRSAQPPEHTVAVTITEKETQTPLENVEVRLGLYRAATDARGVASLDVPRGLYDLDTWKIGYDIVSTTVEVNENVTIHVEAWPTPERDPDSDSGWA